MGLVKLLRAQWDRTAGALLMLAGAVGIVVGWVGVSGAVYPAEQLPCRMSGGRGGLFLLGGGATLWLSADLRDEWRHLDRLESDVERRLTRRVDELVAQAQWTAQPGNDEGPANEPASSADDAAASADEAAIPADEPASSADDAAIPADEAAAPAGRR